MDCLHYIAQDQKCTRHFSSLATRHQSGHRTDFYLLQTPRTVSISCLHKIGANTREGPRKVTEARAYVHVHTQAHTLSDTNMLLHFGGRSAVADVRHSAQTCLFLASQLRCPPLSGHVQLLPSERLWCSFACGEVATAQLSSGEQRAHRWGITNRGHP